MGLAPTRRFFDMRRVMTALLWSSVFMASFVIILSSFAANYPKVLNHPDPVVYFGKALTRLPTKNLQEFTVNIHILNAYTNQERRKIVGFQIDFHAAPDVVGFMGAEEPTKPNGNRNGFFTTGIYDNNMWAGDPRPTDRSFFNRERQPSDTNHWIRTVYADGAGQQNRRSSGVLVTLRFLCLSITKPHLDKDQIKFVRVTLNYEDGHVKHYYDPELNPDDLNTIRVFNTRIVNKLIKGDSNADGRLNNLDLRDLFENYGNYLNNPSRYREPIELIDILRIVDLNND